jgi:hypothetical protein
MRPETLTNLQKINSSLRRSCFGVLLFLLAVIPAVIQAEIKSQTKLTGSEPTQEPAVPAILAAFDKYEVVGIPEGHGMKDMDDFILSVIRDPAFSQEVNDIAVECGNSLYQPMCRSRKFGKYGETRRSRCAACRYSLSSFSLSCAQSIRSSRQGSASGYWRAILRLTGTKSKALRTPENSPTAMQASPL